MTNHYIKIVRLLVLSGSLSIASGQLYADNWMRSEGEGYYKASLEFDSARSKWNQDNKLQSLPCTTRNWNVNQSYEYGMSYYRTFFGSLDYLDRSCGSSEASGIGDLSLGIRGRLNIYRNGRTWETAVIIPTGYSTTGQTSVGSGLFGLRLGLFGSFGNRHLVNGERGTNIELGGNVYLWEGAAPEQFSGYVKYNFAATKNSHFYGSLEGDYALVDRGEDFSSEINRLNDYGYDRLNARFGYATRAGLYWRISFEATNVLWGRNTSDSNSVNVSLSRTITD